MRNKNNEIKIGSVLSYTQHLASILVGLLYTPVVIQMLGQSEYGLYSTISSTTALLSIFSLGLSNSYIRYYTKYKIAGNREETYKLNGMFLSIFGVISAITLCCGVYLVSHLELLFDNGLSIPEYETARVLCAILVVQIAISFPMSVFVSIINAHEKFIFLKLLGIIKTVGGPILTLPLLLFGYGSVAVVAVSLLVNIGVDIVYVYYVCKRLNEKFAFKRVEFGVYVDLLVYTAFIALHLIADQVNWNVGKVLLARFKGTQTVAVYAVGYSLFSHYIGLGTPIASLFIPRIHGITANQTLTMQQQRRELTAVFIRIGRIQYLILGCVLGGFIVLGQEFLMLWVGAGYEQAFWVAILLIGFGTIDLIQVVGVEIQRALNRHRFRAYISIVMACVNVVISVYLCRVYGAIGCAAGAAVSFILIQGIIMNIYYHTRCNLDVLAFWKNILRLSCGVVPPILIGFVLKKIFSIQNWMSLFAAIAVYILVYGLSMFYLGVNKEEQNTIKGIFKRPWHH